MLDKVRHCISWSHHVAVLLCLCEIFDGAQQILVKGQDAGNIPAPIAIVGR